MTLNKLAMNDRKLYYNFLNSTHYMEKEIPKKLLRRTSCIVMLYLYYVLFVDEKYWPQMMYPADISTIFGRYL